ncbi:hypothetical protein, partial [Neobacillus kokaensis]|uniref:hypothetical protein n=1 Tax=Neobacillus kokaensis TaxID=2759023 RepID=UPI001CB92D04
PFLDGQIQAFIFTVSRLSIGFTGRIKASFFPFYYFPPNSLGQNILPVQLPSNLTRVKST